MAWSNARFSTTELIRFLRCVDEELRSKAPVLVIGSTAAVLWTNDLLIMSADIDVLWALTPELEQACARARAKTGLPIPVNHVGVWDAPYGHEDRRQRLDLGTPFTHLEVWVPERHDWALMKMVRGEQHDLDLVVEVHRRRPFEEPILLERGRSMLTTLALGPPERFKTTLFLLFERLFGAERAAELEQQL